MPEVKVTISEYIDDSQPGWVRVILKDVNEREWYIQDKVPIFTEVFLDAKSDYPLDGYLNCTILERRETANGYAVYRIDISSPIGVEDVNGNTTFEVLEEQLIM